MNTEILKGKWNQIKGQIKIKWSQLTDDDIARIDGEMDQLTGKLQERYGYSKDEAHKEAKKFFDQV